MSYIPLPFQQHIAFSPGQPLLGPCSRQESAQMGLTTPNHLCKPEFPTVIFPQTLHSFNSGKQHTSYGAQNQPFLSLYVSLETSLKCKVSSTVQNQHSINNHVFQKVRPSPVFTLSSSQQHFYTFVSSLVQIHLKLPEEPQITVILWKERQVVSILQLPDKQSCFALLFL